MAATSFAARVERTLGTAEVWVACPHPPAVEAECLRGMLVPALGEAAVGAYEAAQLQAGAPAWPDLQLRTRWHHELRREMASACGRADRPLLDVSDSLLGGAGAVHARFRRCAATSRSALG